MSKVEPEWMGAKWNALSREAEMAAEHLGIGATALGRANYYQQSYYYQAFFALSIGIERSAKLGVLVDYVLDHDGTFPPSEDIEKYRHNLQRLLQQLEQIGSRRGLSVPESKLPNSDIHRGIIETLTDFARNVTRYYNLQLVTDDPKAAQRDDPVSAWYKQVTAPVIEAHYTDRQHAEHDMNARIIEGMLGNSALVRHVSETGESVDSVYEGSKLTGMTEFAKPWERMYVLQIARFIAQVLSHLGHLAWGRASHIPYLSEFFGVFNNSDKSFRSHKVWSIY